MQHAKNGYTCMYHFHLLEYVWQANSLLTVAVYIDEVDEWNTPKKLYIWIYVRCGNKIKTITTMFQNSHTHTHDEYNLWIKTNYNMQM